MKPYYLTDIKCTYMLHDYEFQEDLYRIQFLQIFKIKKWNDTIINSTIENLFNYINDIFKHNSESLVLHDCHINNILDKIKMSNKLQNILIFCGDNDNLNNFKLLFSFDYFQYSHSYFCELINNYKIDDCNNTCLLNSACLERDFCNEKSLDNNQSLINVYDIIYNKI
jgi:hypothetical protein